MNSKQFAYLVFILILITQISTAQRTITELSNGWKFQKGNNDLAFQKNFDDFGWQMVSVPHDWAIEGPFIAEGDGNTGKLLWKGESWYRNKFTLSKNDSGKRLYLLFDGIMAFPTVYINGKMAGKWDYGYNSFYIDITDFVDFNSKNVVAIHVDTRKHDSRWYPGAGIYRKVQLIAVNPVHIGIWGTYITTPVIKPNMADVRTETTIENNSSGEKEIVVRNIIYSKTKKALQEKSETITVPANGVKTAETIITMSNPTRWEIENPHLYSMVTEIYFNKALVDSSATNFGVRDIRMTADNGLYLNDKRV